MSGKNNERRATAGAVANTGGDELADNDTIATLLACLGDRNLRDVAESLLRHDDCVMTDEARSELSRLCSRVPAGRRSLTEWVYLLARDAAGEPIDSPSDGRFAAFRAFADAEQQFEFALVRMPRAALKNGGSTVHTLTVTIPAFRGKPAQRVEMPLGEPVTLGARQAIFVLQQFPLCAVETSRPGGDLAGV